MKFVLLVILPLMLIGCAATPVIHDRPISFPAERVALTKAYMADRYGIVSDSIVINP